MEVKLTKQDLISLVRGSTPYYSVFDEPLVKRAGTYIGGMRDEWHWNTLSLKKLSEIELWELYNICKQSQRYAIT